MKRKNINNRRQFLKKGIQSAALAAIVPAGLRANDSLHYNRKKHNKFVYRTLGNTGIKLPVISMGTGDTNNLNLISITSSSSFISTMNLSSFSEVL